MSEEILFIFVVLTIFVWFVGGLGTYIIYKSMKDFSQQFRTTEERAGDLFWGVVGILIWILLITGLISIFF